MTPGAAHRCPPVGPAARRVLTVLLSVLVLVGALTAAPFGVASPADAAGPGAGPAAVAADVTDADSEATEEEVTGRVTVSVTSLAPEVVSTGEDVTITGTITNGTEQALTDATLVVQMQSRTEMTTAGLASWLGDEHDTPLETVAVQTQSEQVAPGAERSFRVTVSSDDMPLSDTDQWGPRGVQVALTQGYTTLTQDRTILLWNPGVRVSPTRVTVFVPVTASPAELLALTAATPEVREEAAATPPASTDPTAGPSASGTAGAVHDPTPTQEGTATESADSQAGPTDAASADPQDGDAGTAQTLSALRERVLGLLELAGDGIVLAVDPALLAALGLDSAAPVAATAAPAPTEESAQPEAADADRLGTALGAALEAGDVIVLPWADADLTALAHLGEDELLDSALERARDSAAASSGAGTELAWAAGSLDATTLAALPDSVTTVVAHPGDAAVAEYLTYTPSGTMLLDGRTVLIPEEELSAAAGGSLATGEGDARLPELDAVQLLRGQSAILTRQAPALSRDLVVAVSREDAAHTDPQVLRQRLAALTGSTWMQPQDLQSLLESAADSATAGTEAVRMALPDSTTGEGEVTAITLGAARQAATRLDSVASILSDPTRALGVSTDVVALTASASWREDESACTAMINQARAHGETVIQGLAAAPSSTINLIASAADLPVRIVSSLDQDVTVKVHLESSSTRLQISEDVTVTVPAGGQATASVPVTAVGSGDVDVTIQLRADDDALVGTPSTVHLRVRADWENMGTRILSGVLVILLVAGIVRTVRRGRRTATPRERR
ncbi:DUF6049 family protein [Actinomyces procaprae]|uniref:DUF6049 family protein n=1 Tax=Actinomyces procaprae TaxID=2560010 RepID=UPI00144524E7|nr:DUF6049 family protein [Actinomyces procaprae]